MLEILVECAQRFGKNCYVTLHQQHWTVRSEDGIVLDYGKYENLKDLLNVSPKEVASNNEAITTHPAREEPTLQLYSPEEEDNIFGVELVKNTYFSP